ncbi:MAG: sugar-binding protein [Elusimicrobiota bacterium]
MKKILVLIVMLSFSASAGAINTIWVDDFNDGKPVNKLGGATGCWSVNPSDKNQFCKTSFDAETRLGDMGRSLKLSYDVDTPFTYNKEFPNIGKNGYFTQLKGMNLEKMKYLVISVRGDELKGFTRTLTFELKNSKETGSFVLEGVMGQWQKYMIPIHKFGLKNVSSVTELFINFNEKSTKKTGTIYVDDIYFVSSSQGYDAFAAKLGPGEKITVDGDLREWENFKNVKLMRYDAANNLETGYVKSKDDLDVTAAFRWDEQYLYFAAWVRDEKILCPFKGPEIYKGDCIEVYIDPQDDGLLWGDSKDFQIGFCPISPDSDEPQNWAWFQNQDPGGNVELASLVVKKRRWEGYQIEAAIKWKYMDITPRKGMVIGVSPAINDWDGADALSGKLIWVFNKETGKLIRLGEMQLTE